MLCNTKKVQSIFTSRIVDYKKRRDQG